MQVLARLKKVLIIVRAEFNQGSCTSQLKIELNSVSFRARFHRDAIGLGRNPVRLRRGSIGVYARFVRDSGETHSSFKRNLSNSGESETQSGAMRNPSGVRLKFERNASVARSKFERRLIRIRAELLQNSSGVTQDFEGIQAGFRQGLGKAFTVKCHP